MTGNENRDDRWSWIGDESERRSAAQYIAIMALASLVAFHSELFSEETWSAIRDWFVWAAVFGGGSSLGEWAYDLGGRGWRRAKG